MSYKEPYQATEYRRELEGFEYGLYFAEENLQEMADRDTRSFFWVFGVTEEALIDGFELLDKDDEPLPIMDEIESHFEDTNYMQEFIQGISLTRLYGRCGFMHYDDGTLVTFKPKNMALTYDVKQRKFISARLTEFIAYAGSDSPYEKTYTSDNGLDAFFLCILDPRHKTNNGRSVLEPIWDTLNSLYICNFMETIAVAQLTGVKIMKTPMAGSMTPAQKTEALLPLRHMSSKLALIIPSTDDLEFKTPTGLESISAIQMDLYSALAAATGYPKNLWMGDSLGQLAGADQSGKKLLEVHKVIQQKSVPYVKKSMRRLADIMGWNLPDVFKVNWKTKASISEQAQATLDLTNSQTDIQDSKILTGNEIRERRGLEALAFFDEQEQVPLFYLESKVNTMKFEIIGENENEPTAKSYLDSSVDQPKADPSIQSGSEQPDEPTNTDEPTV